MIRLNKLTGFVFCLTVCIVFSYDISRFGWTGYSHASVRQGSPPTATPTATVTATEQSTVKPTPFNTPVTANIKQGLDQPMQSINKELRALDEDGEKGPVPFDHDSHAFKASYSIDGNSIVACVACHHTDQPRTPGRLSERLVTLTYTVWKGLENKKVKNCKDCHFLRTDIPSDKTIPVLNGKEYDNEVAYHENCTLCHASAAERRTELKEKKKFATRINQQCSVCHG